MELADLVRKSAAELGHQVEIQHFPNPRVEMEEHYYNPTHTKLLDLGLQPHFLGEELVRSMLRIIEAHKHRVIERAIVPRTRWKPGELEGEALGGAPEESARSTRAASSRSGSLDGLLDPPREGVRVLARLAQRESLSLCERS